MPAYSEKQKNFMTMVKAYKKGKLDLANVKQADAIRKAAGSMSYKDIEDFIKECELTKKKKEEVLEDADLTNENNNYKNLDKYKYINVYNKNNHNKVLEFENFGTKWVGWVYEKNNYLDNQDEWRSDDSEFQNMIEDISNDKKYYINWNEKNIIKEQKLRNLIKKEIIKEMKENKINNTKKKIKHLLHMLEEYKKEWIDSKK